MENVQLEINNQGIYLVVDKYEIKLITQSIKELYIQEMKLYATRKQQLRSNRSKSFGTIWSQCIPTLQPSIINLNEYDEKRKEYECLWLLENVNYYRVELIVSKTRHILRMKSRRLYIFSDNKKNESLDSYYRNCLSIIKTAKLMGIS